MTGQTIQEMIAIAQEYCRLVESLEDYSREQWLTEMSALLPKLHVAISELDVPIEGHVHDMEADFDERFELFTSLYMTLGERDGYMMEFDAANDGQRLSGSLADDFTDIYFDLKQGLKLMQQKSADDAANDWRYSYKKHWGQHLVDAERQLYHMSVERELGH